MHRFKGAIKIGFLSSLTSYLVLSLLVGVIAFRYFYVGNILTMWKQFQYNNPLLVISSVALFWTFKNCSFHSRFVNWFAGSVLAIYLVHDHIFFRERVVHINEIYGVLTPQTIGILLLLLFSLMFGVVLLDKLRLVITNPIVRFLTSKSEQIQDKIESKLNHTV